MKNTYYVIFILCLTAAQTKPMITSGSANDYENYYKLNNMPEDVLKEIAMQESGKFSLEDLKNAPYYQKCINFSKHITLGDDATTMLNATSNYSDTIKTLSYVDKQLHQTLTDLRNQLNPVPEENALLKLHYFDNIFANYHISKKKDSLISHIIAQLIYKKSQNKSPIFFIYPSYSFSYNEYETLKLPKAIKQLDENRSFSDADYVLQMLKEEVFHNEDKIEKLITLMHYFQTISEQYTFGTVERSSFDNNKGSAHFRIYVSNERNKGLITYLLIKSLFTDAE